MVQKCFLQEPRLPKEIPLCDRLKRTRKTKEDWRQAKKSQILFLGTFLTHWDDDAGEFLKPLWRIHLTSSCLLGTGQTQCKATPVFSTKRGDRCPATVTLPSLKPTHRGECKWRKNLSLDSEKNLSSSRQKKCQMGHYEIHRNEEDKNEEGLGSLSKSLTPHMQ